MLLGARRSSRSSHHHVKEAFALVPEAHTPDVERGVQSAEVERRLQSKSLSKRLGSTLVQTRKTFTKKLISMCTHPKDLKTDHKDSSVDIQHRRCWEEEDEVAVLVDSVNSSPNEPKQDPAFPKSSEKLAVEWAIARLSPLVEPALKRHGLRWADVVPIFEQVDCIEDLLLAKAELDDFMKSIAKDSDRIAIKWFIATIRPKVEPTLNMYGIQWADVVPVINNVDSIKELQLAAGDPDDFMQLFAKCSVKIAIKFEMMKLQPELEPVLQNQGYHWADALQVMDLVENVEQLQGSAAHLESFMGSLARDSEKIALKCAIAKLRPKVQQVLNKCGLQWTDLLPIIEQVDSLEELQEGAVDPDGFLELLAKRSKAIAVRMFITRLWPKLGPILSSQGLQLQSAEVVSVIELADSLEELEVAAAKPEDFVESLTAGSQRIAVKWAIVKLRPKIERSFVRYDLQWADLVPIIEQLASIVGGIEELQEATGDFECFMDSLAKRSEKIAFKWFIAKLRPKVEPTLTRYGLQWSDVLPIIEQVGIEELQQAARDTNDFMESLAKSSKKVALKFAFLRLAPAVKLALGKPSRQWADCEDVVEEVHSFEQLQQALAEIDTFVASLANGSEELAIRWPTLE
jgi:predicted protein tyrosine phosphatase